MQQSTPACSRRIGLFLGYLLAFYGLWSGWVYGVYPWMKTLGEDTLQYALVNIIFRLLLWVAPVGAYLYWIDGVNPIAYLKLQRSWKYGVRTGLIFTAVNFLLSALRFGLPTPMRHTPTWNDILSTSLFIGLIEEIPYRGFILQKLQDYFPFWSANAITTLLFVAIHLPGWIMFHVPSAATIGGLCLLSLVLGVLFHSTKSLWSVIIAHSLNDFLAVVIFRQ
jgi:uncharacterized protein